MIYLSSNFRTQFPRNAFFDWDVELSPNKLFLCTRGYEKGSWMSMPDMLDVCQGVCAYSMRSVCVCLLRSCGYRFLPESQVQVTTVMSEVTQRRFLGFSGGTTTHTHTHVSSSEKCSRMQIKIAINSNLQLT